MKLWLRKNSSRAIIALLLCVGTLFVTAGVLAYGPESTANLFAFIPGASGIAHQFAGVPLTEASVATDMGEYAPGQIVQITGAGFMSGENVQLRVVYVPG